MEPFTTDELLDWIDERFDYELKEGEITARMYAQAKGLDHNTAGGRLNKLVRLGVLTSFRAIVDGKNVRVFRQVPSVEYETTD